MGKQKAPWLSVIVPIYNTEKYLPKCINSILTQSFTDFELLLIDDDSTDSSAKICNAFVEADNRVKYFKKANGGCFQTRIYGMEQAIGERILFCDSDDYYVNSKVFQLLYEKATETNCDVVQFGFLKKYNHMKKADVYVKTPKLVNRDEFVKNEYPKLLCSFWDAASLSNSAVNKLYRRRLFENAPKSDTIGRLFWGEDLSTNLHVLEKCNSALFLPDALYVYRQFTGGTKRFSKNTMRDLDNIKHLQLQFLERYEIPDKKALIEELCMQEIAKWFYVYVCQGVKELSEAEMRELIASCLALDSFQKCREFYCKRPTDPRKEIVLIREGDVDRYIESAKAIKDKKSIKKTVKDFLKMLYKRI